MPSRRGILDGVEVPDELRGYRRTLAYAQLSRRQLDDVENIEDAFLRLRKFVQDYLLLCMEAKMYAKCKVLQRETREKEEARARRIKKDRKLVDYRRRKLIILERNVVALEKIAAANM